MKEIKYITTTMTENSLIIIDELCRSTSLEEGTALAIAVIEKMAQSSAFIYITTHFTLLTKLYDMYLNVKLWQLETIPSGEDPKTFKLDFKHSLIPGVTSVKRYGVYIVRNIWPDSILKDVDEMLDNMTKKPTDPNIVAIDEKVRLKYNLEAQFRKLKSRKNLTVAEVNKLLSEYQTELKKLGYSINVHPLSSSGSFVEQVEANMPHIRHSILENSQSFPEYIQDHVDDVHLREERIKHIFTPEASVSSQVSMSDPEARKTEERLMNVFTPEESQISTKYSLLTYPNIETYNNQHDIDFRENDDLSDTSSYQNISNFIGENSENIHKLIPEVNISIDNLEENNSSSQRVFGLKPESSNNLRETFIKPQTIRQPKILSNQNKNVGNMFEPSSSIDLSKDMNDFRFSLPLQNSAGRTSTPVPHQKHPISQSSSPAVRIYSQRQNFSTPSSNILDFNINFHNMTQTEIEHANNLEGIDIKSICEDLEVCSKIFTENYDDFDETCSNNTYESLQDSGRNSPDKEPQTKLPHLNLMPRVTIIEGLNNTTLSIDENDLKDDANNSTTMVPEPKTKVNIISDILVAGNAYDKNPEKNESNINEDNVITHKSPESEKELQLNENATVTFQITEGSNNTEKMFRTKTDSSTSVESDDGPIGSSRKTLAEPFVNYRRFQAMVSDSKDSFKSSKSDSTKSENASTGTDEGHKLTQAYYDVNINDWSISTDIDESYKSLEEDASCNSESNIKLHETLDDLSKNNIDSHPKTNKTPGKLNFTSSDHEIDAVENHDKTKGSVDESNLKELYSQNEELEEISTNNKCVEEKQEAENNLKISTNLTISISNASKLRNLDQVTSDSSIHEENSTKKTSSTNNDKTITSVSSASKKRNLDDITTTSSPSGQSNNKSTGKMETTKSGSTSSQEKSNVGKPKRKKVARKQFCVPRTAENKTVEGSPQTSTTTSKSKESHAKPRKFKPPRKLTAKEIREEFREQDRKILESSPNSSNYSKYLEQLIRRPSVKQIQNTTHLAVIRKTHEGMEVIPAVPAMKKRKRSPMKRHFSNEKFNMTIFSDKNAVPFEQYLNSNVKDYKTFQFNFGATQENGAKEKFKFMPTTNSNFDEYTNNSVTTHFVRTASEIQTKGIWSQENVKATTFTRQKSYTSDNSQLFFSQKSNNPTLTPDGFYKENKDDITRIMNKYLQGGTEPSQNYFKRGVDRKRNIFENTDLNTSDLNI